ncbi:MAG: hypothetical protein K2X27_07370, partial [Candidatus Obscuribacterales bacterium]|nr:hypothetical protein [Candidatus Obscuribacterales bacterium]
MNPWQIIATLRKFGNYLAGLFPFLARLADLLVAKLSRLLKHPGLTPAYKRLSENRHLQATALFFERFYWRNYAKDRLDLSQTPGEISPLLQMLFRICVLFCLAIPLTQFSPSSLSIETFSGFKSSCPHWAAFLWTIFLPFAWAAILSGTALSSRPLFCIASIAACYFLSTCVLSLPRSFSNALLPLAIFFSIYFFEYQKRKNSGGCKLGFLSSLISGSFAGIPLIALTPLRPLISEQFHLQSPLISLAGGPVLGIILSLFCIKLARLNTGFEISLRKAFAVLTIVLLSYVGSALLRGNLSITSSLALSSLNLSNNYLWPIWY